MHFEYFYYAMMFLIALPLAWRFRSIVAVIVFATWAVGQVAYQIGLPEPPTQTVLYAVAFGFGMARSRTAAGLFAAVLFFPLAVASACQWAHVINDVQAWWTIYWIALTQALSLPFVVDWESLKRGSKPKQGEDGGMLRIVHA